MRYIDLSAEISPSPEQTPAYLKTEISYYGHAAGAAQAASILGVSPSAFRNDEGWAVEVITRLSTHDTTHVDAPYHYNSEIEGHPAQTIDQLPLEWFFADGVVLDMTHKQDGETVTVSDLQHALERTEHTMNPLDIVLIRTDCDKYYSSPDYMFRGCGVSPEATLWLVDRGIRVTGIDAWGWDAPLNRQAASAHGKLGTFWAAHQVNRSYCHMDMERLVNLAALPPTGFRVACFPLKIKAGSAGPARVVAMLS